jgi:hypothetical protein
MVCSGLLDGFSPCGTFTGEVVWAPQQYVQQQEGQRR